MRAWPSASTPRRHRSKDTSRRIDALQQEIDILDRETAVGRDHAERRAELTVQLDQEKTRHEELNAAG